MQAESVAYVVSSWLGLDTSDYSFGHIASWSNGRDVSELRASLDEIRSAPHRIIDTIEKETSKTREPEVQERTRQAERKAERTMRGLAERVGTARLASVGERMHTSRVSEHER